MSDIKYWGNDNPICPFCDKILNISEYDLFFLYEEGEHEIDCPECDHKLIVNTRVKHLFDTDCQEDDY